MFCACFWVWDFCFFLFQVFSVSPPSLNPIKGVWSKTLWNRLCRTLKMENSSTSCKPQDQVCHLCPSACFILFQGFMLLILSCTCVDFPFWVLSVGTSLTTCLSQKVSNFTWKRVSILWNLYSDADPNPIFPLTNRQLLVSIFFFPPFSFSYTTTQLFNPNSRLWTYWHFYCWFYDNTYNFFILQKEKQCLVVVSFLVKRKKNYTLS